MTRTLVLSDPNFQILFLAFITHKLPPGMVYARLGRDIKRKFEKMGKPDEQGLVLSDEWKNGTMAFTQAEYEYLEKCLEAFEYQPAYVDKVADCMDWFSAADKVNDCNEA